MAEREHGCRLPLVSNEYVASDPCEDCWPRTRAVSLDEGQAMLVGVDITNGVITQTWAYKDPFSRETVTQNIYIKES